MCASWEAFSPFGLGADRLWVKVRKSAKPRFGGTRRREIILPPGKFLTSLSIFVVDTFFFFISACDVNPCRLETLFGQVICKASRYCYQA